MRVVGLFGDGFLKFLKVLISNIQRVPVLLLPCS